MNAPLARPAAAGALPCGGRRSPLYRQTVFPVPGFDFPCGGEEDSLCTGAHAEYTPEGGSEAGSLTVTTDGGSDSHAVTLVSH